MAKAVESRIVDLVGADVEAAGYDLVRARITGNGKYASLQIMAERRDGAGMTVEDCSAISAIVSAKLEADAALADKYDLEVSSPGIDRPLIRLNDYARYQGHVAKVDLTAAIDGQKKFQGKIASVDGDKILFVTEKGSLDVPFAGIEQAKLVMTDELLKAAAQGKVSH